MTEMIPISNQETFTITEILLNDAIARDIRYHKTSTPYMSLTGGETLHRPDVGSPTDRYR